jgi:hypothetical protein
VNDDKAREEALLKASRAEAEAAEAAVKAAEAAKAAKAAEEAKAAKQAEILAHKPQLDHIMVRCSFNSYSHFKLKYDFSVRAWGFRWTSHSMLSEFVPLFLSWLSIFSVAAPLQRPTRMPVQLAAQLPLLLLTRSFKCF